MTMVSHVCRFIPVVVYFICVSCVSAAPGDGDYYVGFDVGSLTGSYDTALDSDLYSFQLVGGYLASSYDMSISVPYLVQHDGAGYTNTGLGDVLFQIGHSLRSRQADGFSVDGSLMVKLPTADESKGLGTGQLDVGLVMDIGHQWPPFSGSLRAGFINTGDTAVENYNDSFLYGISFFRLAGRFGNYLSVDGRTAALDNVADPLELQIGTFYAVNADYVLNANAVFGLAASSPDYGLSIGLRYWLD